MSQHNPRNTPPLLNQNNRDEAMLRSSTSIFSGPIPPPEVFARYEGVLSGSADRILKMAEAQSAHRQVLEKKVISSEQSRATVGLVFGFIICLTVIIGGFVLIYLEKEWLGFSVLVGGIGALIGTFVYGKKQKKIDLSRKEKDFSNRVRELNNG
ncbi:MAG: hypothetical protein A2445_04280 [Candidatus Jacksonbacteria bacterium RIFOXYC2_FULL_44_29]|nr:MAG: Membrane protein, PF10097 family [Parcubacteria group bacterium GW2011_GWC2_44_22]OGY74872.1 MAG: hypothetical protein A2240_01950 [Candidatus Jacksonbacteria bacterium RIFOXYA2_FULL_43_12]OGY75459.1 MAG: hypothetical protein A2295_05420 [Candidatus Jacksonbacteria bacterium RIFOXYB2_FULL_44_15]OGY78229.1 MAG: hypothetical protein A2445_04280 [Candidatus Jacksonbacteria bacterium RIFOXYC2_FULL_44_29]OGY80716.1 MAG: hypothetical protein A2550_00590 [Candidatus Jacksonbacteria bacterium R